MNNGSRFVAAHEFAEHVLQAPLERFPPVMLTGLELVHQLWPLIDVFRPTFDRVRSVRYNEAFEPAADEALDRFVWGNGVAEWRDLEPAVWRVLLERFTQWLVVAMANEAADNPVTPVPLGFPESQLLPFLMLSLMRGMKLPLPVHDESALEGVMSQAPPSLRRN